MFSTKFGIYKMLVRIANRESEAVLSGSALQGFRQALISKEYSPFFKKGVTKFLGVLTVCLKNQNQEMTKLFHNAV